MTTWRAIMLVPLTAGLALAGGPGPARAQGPEPHGTVVSVEGDVTWQAARAAAFVAAKAGDTLLPGARIRTGARSFATLRWRNGGDFKLYPLSELSVPEEDGVLIEAGKVWAEFKQKLLGPFFFRAPGATAVVRGTTLGVEVLPAGETYVEVWEGRVEVLGARGQASRMLEPGQSILVSPMGLFGPLQPVLPAPELRRMQNGVGMAGPDRRPGGDGGPRKGGGFDWLNGNRAAVRLEEARGWERVKRAEPGSMLFRGPDGGRPGGGPPGQPGAGMPGRGGPGGRHADGPERADGHHEGGGGAHPDANFPTGRLQGGRGFIGPLDCPPGTSPVGPPPMPPLVGEPLGPPPIPRGMPCPPVTPPPAAGTP